MKPTSTVRTYYGLECAMKTTAQYLTVSVLALSHLISGCTVPAADDSPRTLNAAKADNPTDQGLKRDYVNISGNVGLAGVILKGLPSQTVSDSNGRYACVIEPNWSGEVSPILAGYQFRPSSRLYTRMVSNTENQDYIATKATFPISGSTGLEGVVMKGLPGDPVTSADGCYRAVVDYGWTGTVTPTKQGCRFEPASRTYEHATQESIHDNYVARKEEQEAASATPAAGPAEPRVAPPARRGRVRRPSVLVVTDAEGADGQRQIREDLGVMSLILCQAVEGRDVNEAGASTGPEAMARPAVEPVQALYCQGWGVVFSLQLRPALPIESRAVAEGSNGLGPSRDPVWQRARRQVATDPSRQAADANTAYSADLEQRFKARLVAALPHASNIRHLAPEQWVVVVLIGGSDPLQEGEAGILPDASPVEHAAVLRVRKQDIDASAAGLLDLALFQSRVQTALQ
jgi:hypothetical protein